MQTISLLRSCRSLLPHAVGALTLLCAASGGSTTFTWNGGGADGNFSTALNWVGGVAPATAGNDFIFGALVSPFQSNADVNLGSNPSSFTFAAGAAPMTITNSVNAMQLAAGTATPIANNSTNLQFFNCSAVKQFWISGTTNRTWSANAGNLQFNQVNFRNDSMVGTNVTLTLTGTSNGVINGNIVYEGSWPGNKTVGLIKSGTGKWTLNGSGAFTAGTRITAGTLQLNHALALQSSTVDMNAADAGGLEFGSAITATTLGGLQGTRDIVLTNTAGGDVNLSVGNNNATTTYYGSLSGVAGGLTKVGTGSLVLASNLTFSGSGTVTVSAGTLEISNSIATGLSGLSGTVSSGATLRPDLAGTYASLPLTITGSGASGTFGALYFIFNSGTATWPGAITLGAGGASIGSFGVAPAATFTGGISGTGPLSFNGRGGSVSSHTATFTISTTACSYTGDTTIKNNDGVKEATLKIGLNNALPVGTVLNLNIANNASTVGATFDLNGKNQQLGGLAKNTTGTSTKYRVLNSSGTTSTLTISNAATAYSFDGLIGIASNDKLNLVKLGAATLTLAGANLYAGNTTIGAGTLALSSSGSIAQTPQISIADGATFDVSANTSGFTFTGSGPVQTLAGSSPAGTATITAGTGAAGVTVASGALLSFQADGTSDTLGKISISGDLNLNANDITVNVTGADLSPGDYPLLNCSGTLVNTGTFGTPTITGTPLGGGNVASIVVNPGVAGNVVLHIGTAGLTSTTTTVTQTAGSNPSTYGDSVTFQAVVSPDPGDGETITFYTNGVAIGTSTTSSGAANLTISTLKATGGSALPVSAGFGGNGSFDSSLGTLSGGHTVNPYALSFTVNPTPQNKVANGSTAAALTGGTLTSTLFSDVVAATNASFVSAAAGVGVVVTNVVLSGPDAANYTINPQPAGLTATIYAYPTWANTAGGSWSNTVNWVSGTVANGSGVTADFSQIDPATDVTVSLSTARTISSLIFGDTNNASAAGWTLDNGGTPANILTLAGGTPTITVANLAAGKAATVSAAISGAANLTKAGNGTLVLAGNTALGSSLLYVNEGKLVITNGGAVSVGSSAGQGVAAGAELEINGGSFNSGYSSVGLGSGTGTLTLNSGNYTNTLEILPAWSGDGVVNINGGLADLNLFSYPNAAGQTATINLNGGTMQLNRFNSRGGSVSATTIINLNGTTLRAKSAQTDFIPTSTILTVNVRTNGAILDSNGNNLTDNAPLQHDAAMGAAVDGGLTKMGAGTLTLTAANTYTGNTTISGGTLALSGAGAIASATSVSITTNATFDVSAISSGSYANPGTRTLAFRIDKTGGTLKQGQLTLGIKSLTYDGPLTVSETGDALASGDSFTLIVTNGTAGQLSGWFSSVSLPALAPEISWDTNKLATSGALDIYNFSATNLELNVPANSNAVIVASKLANHLSSARAASPYPTGWTAAVTTAATNGIASVDPGTGNLAYTNTVPTAVEDHFTVTVNDGHGWQTMDASVAIGTGTAPSPNVVFGPVVSGGNFVVRFAGIPGTEYTVETNAAASGAGWVKEQNLTAPTTDQGFGIGVFQISDPLSHSSLFYRTVWPAY